jgi:hypothetical protein
MGRRSKRTIRLYKLTLFFDKVYKPLKNKLASGLLSKNDPLTDLHTLNTLL